MIKWVADGVARAVTPLVLLPLLARETGAEGLGIYALVLTLVGLVVPFASLGLTTGTVPALAGRRWDDRVERIVRHAGLVVLAGGAAAGLVMALGAPLLNDLFNGVDDGIPVFRWGGVLVAATAIELYLLEVLRARYLLVLYGLYQLLQAIGVVLAGVLVTDHGGVPAFVAAVALLKFTMVLLTAALSSHRLSVSPGELQVQATSVRSVVALGLPLAVAGLGPWIMNVSDRLIVGFNLGADDVGRYSSVFFLSTLLWIASGGLNLPAFPRIVSAIESGDLAAAAAEVRRFHRYLVMTEVPIAGLLVATGSYALDVAGGNRFTVPTILVALVTLPLLLDQCNGLAHYIVIGFGETRFMRNAWMVSGATNVALGLILVPVLALPGAALASLAAFCLLETIIGRRAFSRLDLSASYDLRTAAVSAAIVIPAAAAVWLSLEHGPGGPIPLLLASIAFVAVYGVAMVATGTLHGDDVGKLIEVVRPAPSVAIEVRR